jgi:hypothetical protein
MKKEVLGTDLRGKKTLKAKKPRKVLELKYIPGFF